MPGLGRTPPPGLGRTPPPGLGGRLRRAAASAVAVASAAGATRGLVSPPASMAASRARAARAADLALASNASRHATISARSASGATDASSHSTRSKSLDPSLGFNATTAGIPRAGKSSTKARYDAPASPSRSSRRSAIQRFGSEISDATSARRQAASNASLRGWDAPWSATSIGTPRAFALWIADPTSPPWKGDDISRALLRRGE